jgi:UMF1 family MFS transporter
LYDFSNTVFSMNVATLYFGTWLVADLGSTNLMYATAGAIASLLVVICIPVLGAVSDARRRRLPWVIGFTLLSCLACAMIGVLGQTTLPITGEAVLDATGPAGWSASVGQLWPVLLAFIIANFAYQAAQPFYNAMLPELVPPSELGRLSGLGAAVGYVGSVVGVILVFPFFTGGFPVVGALSDSAISTLRTIVPFSAHGGRVSTFVPTAVLFLAFSLPLFFFCRDHNPAPKGAPIALRRAFKDVAETLRESKKYPGALRFIVTTLVYQDAIGTIISFMTIYAVTVVGFDKGSEVTLFMVLTIPAIFGSYAAGILVDRIGAKRTLMLTLVIWIVLLFAMIAFPTKGAFWFIGLALGLNFGGVNAAERPLMLSLIPDVYAGRYFSLMMLSARVAAIVGPMIWGLTVAALETPFGPSVASRAAVFTVAVMFAIALWILRRVPDLPPGSSPAPAS